jgi:aldos-2-ulose dehydratase
MNWATVPDYEFDPGNPNPAQYDSIIVSDLEEHGPLWRTSRDGIPERRINGTVDYPWHSKRQRPC